MNINSTLLTRVAAQSYNVNQQAERAEEQAKQRHARQAEHNHRAGFKAEVAKVSTAALTPQSAEAPQEAKQESASVMTVNFDLNGDGIIDSTDLGMLLGAMGSGKDSAQFDFNQDGTVDHNDVKLLTSFFGKSGPQAILNPDLDQNGVVDTNDLGKLLASIGTDKLEYDLNQDGVVDQTDLDILLAFFGKTVGNEQA